MEQRKDGWMESAEPGKENRKHYCKALWCALSIIWTCIWKTARCLNTLFWGNLESRDICPGTPVPVPWASGSFASSLDFSFKQSEPWLQSTAVQQDGCCPQGPHLEQVFSLCCSCLYSWFSPTEICLIARSRGAIGPIPQKCGFWVSPFRVMFCSGSRKEHFGSHQACIRIKKKTKPTHDCCCFAW